MDLTKELKLLLLLTLFITVIGCRTDEEVPIDVPQEETRLVFNADQIPEIKKVLLEVIGKRNDETIFSANTGDFESELVIDWEGILQLVDSTGKETYTFGIEDDDGDFGTFYNLILKIDPKGDPQRPFLYKYIMDDEFMEAYINTGSLENFSGSIQKIFINGPSNSSQGFGYAGGVGNIDDLSTSPCPSIEIDNNGADDISSGGLGNASWKCETFLIPTDWYDCYNESCTNRSYSHTTFEVTTECDLVMDNGANDIEDLCDPRDDVTPVKLPKKNIDDSLIKKCHQDILYDLTYKLGEDKIEDILKKFSGISENNYNWRLKYGATSGTGTLATTSTTLSDDFVETKIDWSKVKNASDLSMAKTLVHEAIHAYLIYYFKDDNVAASKEYSKLVEDFITLQNANSDQPFGQANHNEMVRSWIADIASTIEAYGINKGYSHGSNFYNDLAWGGLTNTQAFKNLTESAKKRIIDLVVAEATGSYNGIMAKGKKACTDG